MFPVTFGTWLIVFNLMELLEAQSYRVILGDSQSPILYSVYQPGCIPTKFECQEDKRKRTCSYKERPYMLKKQRMSIIAEYLKEPEPSSTASSSVQDTSNTSSDFKIVGENVPETLYELTANKSVQALITHKFRSKAVQTTIKSTEKALSPLKLPTISTSTSPFKWETIINSSPSMSGPSKTTRNV
nr:uncharacterized protein LOC113403311 [Vanessa tameamea]